MIKKYIVICTLLGAFFSPISQASKIEVVNENKKEIDIKIMPEGDSTTVYKIRIPAAEIFSFEMAPKLFKGKQYFSIKGDTSSFTPGGKCERLDCKKDYVITFQDDKVGTSCVADEIPPKK